LVRLVRGTVELPEELPPGLDEDLVADGGILTCCLYPSGSCDIDVIPPL
jgi:ferredoxin